MTSRRHWLCLLPSPVRAGVAFLSGCGAAGTGSAAKAATSTGFLDEIKSAGVLKVGTIRQKPLSDPEDKSLSGALPDILREVLKRAGAPHDGHGLDDLKHLRVGTFQGTTYLAELQAKKAGGADSRLSAQASACASTVNKRNADFVKLFNEYYGAMKKDGTNDRIFARYVLTPTAYYLTING